MQTQKWVNLGLLFSSATLFLFLGKLTGFVWDAARLPILDEWPVPPAQLISFIAAAGLGFWVRRYEKANIFFNEVALELSKVVWSNRKETVQSAGIVIVLLGLSSLLLFVIDSLWGTLIRGALAT